MFELTRKEIRQYLLLVKVIIELLKTSAVMMHTNSNTVARKSFTFPFVFDFECFGFNVSIWVPWSPLGPKKS